MIGGLTPFELFGAFGTAATIFGGGLQLGRKLSTRNAGKELDEAKGQIASLEDKSSQLDTALKAIRRVLNDEADVWLRPHPDLGKHITEIRSSIPIITVCNFKGGVGKTTLSSLLAAYFDLAQGKKVLLIDFDYQGSLTDTLLASADIPNLEASSRRLIQNEQLPNGSIVAHSTALHPALSRTRLFTCFYGFNRLENSSMMNWVSDPGSEVRLRTHHVLNSPEVQTAFDLVIIDAPPRLSTATVNAFCASTHVLVPSILDSMSTQAALNTLNVVGQFREHLNPGLELLGVVPTMVTNQTGLNARERDSLERLDARLPEYWKKPPLPHVFRDTPVCRREAIAKAAGTDLAYNSTDEVRRMSTALGEAISARVFNDAGKRIGEPPEASDSIVSIANGRRRA